MDDGDGDNDDSEKDEEVEEMPPPRTIKDDAGEIMVDVINKVELVATARKKNGLRQGIMIWIEVGGWERWLWSCDLLRSTWWYGVGVVHTVLDYD